jgi:hypothetical protein
MNGPRADLLSRYGTEEVLREKNAGAGSLIERMGILLLNEALLASNHADDVVVQEEHDRQYEGRREHALAKLEPALHALQHTDVPQMERLASVGVKMGTDLAKIAGMGSLVAGAGRFAMKHPGLVAGAGVLGAGALGAKAINTGVQALGQEPKGPATFGGGRFGTQLANGVNQYGQPQLGTPLL